MSWLGKATARRGGTKGNSQWLLDVVVRMLAFGLGPTIWEKIDDFWFYSVYISSSSLLFSDWLFSNNIYHCMYVRITVAQLSSHTWMLGLWVWIPFKTWMSICLFCLCCPVCRKRPCDESIHPGSRTNCLHGYETEKAAKAQQMGCKDINNNNYMDVNPFKITCYIGIHIHDLRLCSRIYIHLSRQTSNEAYYLLAHDATEVEVHWCIGLMLLNIYCATWHHRTEPVTAWIWKQISNIWKITEPSGKNLVEWNRENKDNLTLFLLVQTAVAA
jgi:hypothetical protein